MHAEQGGRLGAGAAAGPAPTNNGRLRLCAIHSRGPQAEDVPMPRAVRAWRRDRRRRGLVSSASWRRVGCQAFKDGGPHDFLDHLPARARRRRAVARGSGRPAAKQRVELCGAGAGEGEQGVGGECSRRACGLQCRSPPVVGTTGRGAQLSSISPSDHQCSATAGTRASACSSAASAAAQPAAARCGG